MGGVLAGMFSSCSTFASGKPTNYSALTFPSFLEHPVVQAMALPSSAKNEVRSLWLTVS